MDLLNTTAKISNIATCETARSAMQAKRFCQMAAAHMIGYVWQASHRLIEPRVEISLYFLKTATSAIRAGAKEAQRQKIVMELGADEAETFAEHLVAAVADARRAAVLRAIPASPVAEESGD